MLLQESSLDRTNPIKKWIHKSITMIQCKTSSSLTRGILISLPFLTQQNNCLHEMYLDVHIQIAWSITTNLLSIIFPPVFSLIHISIAPQKRNTKITRKKNEAKENNLCATWIVQQPSEWLSNAAQNVPI